MLHKASSRCEKVDNIKKESPDVETPGLLVKALISSYFRIRCFLSKDTGKDLSFQLYGIPLSGYFLSFNDCLHFRFYKSHQLFNVVSGEIKP
jgi:hypothetical protein